MLLTSDKTTRVCVRVFVLLLSLRRLLWWRLISLFLALAACVGGRRVAARGTTTGAGTTRLRVRAAFVGRFRRRTSAWTQGVRGRVLDLWLRCCVFDGCFDGLRGASL